MLSLKHCSGPVDPKFEIILLPVKGAQNQRGEGGQTSSGQKPKYKVFVFLKPPLSRSTLALRLIPGLLD